MTISLMTPRITDIMDLDSPEIFAATVPATSRVRVPVKTTLFLALSVLLVVCSYAANENKDEYDFKEKTKYRIEEVTHDGKVSYSLTSNRECFYTFLSDESVDRRFFSVHEFEFMKVQNLSADLDNDDIAKRYIWSESNTDDDIFLCDSKTWYIGLPKKPKVGSVLHYWYDGVYDGLEYMPLIVVPNYEKMSSFEIEFKHPDNMTVEFEPFFPAGKVPYDVKSSAGNTSLKVPEIPRRLPRSCFPYDYYHVAFLVHFKINGQDVNPTSPDQFSRWYLSKVPVDSTIHVQYADSLDRRVRAASTDEQKLRVIYEYVRSRVHYLADESSLGAIIPRSPNFVLEKKYGDCKDKAWCITKLAEYYHIPGVSIAPICTYPFSEFSGINFNSFNHAIAVADINGKRIWMDPTSRYCEFGNLPEGDISNHALIINAQHAEYVPMVESPLKQPSIALTIDAQIDNLQSATAQIVFRNDDKWRVQNAEYELTASDAKHLLSLIIGLNFQKILLDSFALEVDSAGDLRYRARANLSSFVVQSPTKIYVPQTPFFTVSGNLMERSSDSLGVYISTRSNLNIDLRLHCPSATAEHTAVSLGDNPAIASFRAELSPEEGGVYHFRYDYNEVRHRYVGPNQDTYLRFCKQYLAAKKNMFILNKK